MCLLGAGANHAPAPNTPHFISTHTPPCTVFFSPLQPTCRLVIPTPSPLPFSFPRPARSPSLHILEWLSGCSAPFTLAIVQNVRCARQRTFICSSKKPLACPRPLSLSPSPALALALVPSPSMRYQLPHSYSRHYHRASQLDASVLVPACAAEREMLAGITVT
jgi:hypothetical protein